MSDAAQPSTLPGRFNYKPALIAFILCLVVVLPAIVFDELVLALLITLFVAGWWLVATIAALFQRQWRTALSIVVAAPIFIVITAGATRFNDEIRWQFVRYHYVSIFAKLDPADRLPRRIPEHVKIPEWAGGLGWSVGLEYHESDADARAWQAEQRKWSHSSCRQTLKRLETHFYLNGTYC